MKYKYFLVYQLTLETGLVRTFNQEEILDHRINGIDDIKEIEKSILIRCGKLPCHGRIEIIFYKLF